MNATVGIFGWILDSLAYLAEITVYAIHAVWVSIVGAALAFMGPIDDWLPDIDLLDNALWRLLVMGAVGFFIGVGLMIFVSFIVGSWGIPCILTLVIGFFMFVGLMADPDGDWSAGEWPSFGGRGRPKTPLNL